MIRVTNTLSGNKEVFEPLVPSKVQIYVCGPTVYGLTHVGNARPAVVFDVVRRFFTYSGYEATLVSNYTDVDDKIINRARKDGKTSLEISELYIREFRSDMDRLGVQPPQITPKVTDHIPQIIALIERLIQNGAAYVASNGEVFYSIRSFAEYGKLSKKKIDDLRVGVRIDPGELKRDPLDFSLWKPRKEADEPSWPSPWGEGRPGWHIECSAMAIHYLGETFDIHGGGLDLAHPHHENEIAQSEAATRKIFARYWMHNGLVSISNEKMSKSVGNTVLTRDFIDRYTAEALRFLLLSGHYRSPIDFSEQHIRECQAALHRVYSLLARCSQIKNSTATTVAGKVDKAAISMLVDLTDKFELRWREAMEDDFNTAKSIGFAFELVRAGNAVFDKKGFVADTDSARAAGALLNALAGLGKVLNLFSLPPEAFLSELKTAVLKERDVESSLIETKLKEREQARAAKDWAKSDVLRDELLKEYGVRVLDSNQGSTWELDFDWVAAAPH